MSYVGLYTRARTRTHISSTLDHLLVSKCLLVNKVYHLNIMCVCVSITI